MSIIVPGKKETYGDMPLEEGIQCFECGRAVQEQGRVKIAGGFWAGMPSIFLCSQCARSSDLHCLGGLIGDAIVSNYMAEWPYLPAKVENIMTRLEKSILRAIAIQLQFKLQVKK